MGGGGGASDGAADSSVLAITINFAFDITVFKDGTDIVTIYQGELGCRDCSPVGIPR